MPNVVGGANEFVQGKADVFMFALGAGKVAEVNAKIAGCACCRSIIPRRPWRACASSFRSPMPPRLKPGKGRAGLNEPTWVYAYDYLVLANDKVSDDVVYKLTKLMHDHKKELAANFGAPQRLRSQSHGQGPGRR